MPSLPRLISSLLLAFSAGAAYSQSAWEQAKELAGPNYRPPEVPTPQMKCETCSTRPSTSAPAVRSAPRRAAPPALDPSVAVGAAIFGSFLQGIFTPFAIDSSPDPGELARQEAARRQAEEEAKRRAAEEEARHAALMRSLKATPASVSTTEKKPTSDRVELSALKALDQNGKPREEEIREKAGFGWDTRTETKLAVRFQALPVSAPLPVTPARSLCAGKICRWPEAGEPVQTRIAAGRMRHKRIDSQAVIDWSKLTQKTRLSPRDLLLSQMMADVPEGSAAGVWQLIRGHQRQIKESLKTLATAWLIIAIDQYGGPFGKVLLLLKDTHELAQQDFEDAIKAAQWLGSAETEGMPEVTAVEEAAKPFLYRGITEQEKLSEGFRQAFGVVTDATDLAKKLTDIWQKK